MMQLENLPAEMGQRLAALAASLREAFGADLLSVALYGSAARGDQTAGSDINVVVVLRNLSLESLERGVPAVRSWQSSGNRPILFFSPEWMDRSHDVFPLEFSDMRQWHVVIEGTDPFASLDASIEAMRTQCESELKTKLIHLRTGYLELHGDDAALARLLAASHAPLVALCRGVIRVAGEVPPVHADDAVRRAAALCGFDPAPFADVAAIRRGGPRAASMAVKPLFRRYYAQVEALARAVDGGLSGGAGRAPQGAGA
jgi:hypothetical protein